MNRKTDFILKLTVLVRVAVVWLKVKDILYDNIEWGWYTRHWMFKHFCECKTFKETYRLHSQWNLYNEDHDDKIFMALRISNAVSKNHEVLGNNHNWNKSAFGEAYIISKTIHLLIMV